MSEVVPPKVVGGRYRSLRPLGAGAHGTVDLAEDTLNGGRLVAVKRIEGLVGAGDPEPADAVLRWFLHPQWAEIVDEGRLGELGRFEVSRYVAGESLDRVALPLPEPQVWRLLEDLARVLSALHGLGVVHYDVTPGNVVREAGPEPSFVLTDGGLASLGPVKGIARGTPMFMAPELTEGAGHDHRVDLYSLGLVAFRMVTGVDPFTGGAGEVLGRRRREAAPGVRAIRPELSAALEGLIARLLERDPALRFEDGAALREAIAAARGVALPVHRPDEAVAIASGGPLVGREPELGRFRDACRRALARDTVSATAADSTAPRDDVPDVFLALHAPAGSGATRLVHEMLAVAREEGLPALAMSGQEGTADRRSALRRLADAVAHVANGALADRSDLVHSRLDSRSASHSAQDDSELADSRMIERFVDICERSAARGAFALLVEDFQDLPSLTQDAIRVLARHLLARAEHPDGRPCPRIVLVVDHGAEPPEAMRLADAAQPERAWMALPPLAPDAIRALLAARFPGLEPPAPDLAALVRACDGLPRVLVSLVVEGLLRGDLRRENDRWIWVLERLGEYQVERSVPPGVATALAAASPALRRLVEALALLDTPVTVELARALAADGATVDLVDDSPLLAVSREGGVTRFAVPSRALREAVLSRLSPQALATRRDAVLAALATVDCPEAAPERARLLADAGRPEESLRVLLSASESLSLPARVRAQPTLAALLAGHPERLATPADRLAASRYLVARATPLATFESLTAAVRGSDDDEDLEATCRITRVALDSREPELMRLALALLDPLDSEGHSLTVQRVALLVDSVGIRLALGHGDRALPALQRARQAMRVIGPSARRGAPTTRAYAHLHAAHIAFRRQRFSRAHRHCLAARQLARHAHSGAILGHALNNLSVVLAATGQSKAAERTAMRAIRLKTITGDLVGAALSLGNAAKYKQGNNQLLEAALLHSRALAIAERYADHLIGYLALLALGRIYDHQHNPLLAAATFARCVRTAHELGQPSRIAVVCIHACESAAVLGREDEFKSYALTAARIIRTVRDPELRYAYWIHSGLARLFLYGRTRIRSLARAFPHLGPEAPPATHLAIWCWLRLACADVSLDVPQASASKSFEPQLRRLVAALISRARTSENVMPSLPVATHLELCAILRSDQLDSRAQRVLIEIAVLLARRCPSSLRQISNIDDLADVARQAGLDHVENRLCALKALLLLDLGDKARAAAAFSQSLHATETAIGSTAPVHWREVPCAEHLALLSRVEGTASPESDARTAYATRLHACAHRLLVSSGAGSNPDARTQVAMRTVLTVAARLHGGSGVDSLLESLTQYAREITRAERACVVVTSPDGTSTVRVASGVADEPINLEQISRSVINRVIATRAPLLVHDVYGDAELMGRPSIATLSLRSALCVPMLRESRLLGVLYADSAATAGCFDRVDLEVLSLFAEQAAGAIEASRLLDDVQRSYDALKGMQERLIRGERLRVMGEMTSGVAHEFNNLLTAILARIQLVSLEHLTPEIREHLQLIESAALDAAGVVRRLQSFSRASQRANFTRVDMHDVCSDVTELLRPLWSTRRRQGKPSIIVRLQAERGLFVDGDPTELREVVTNLLKNALDAVERGGSITLAATREQSVVRIDVRDDGPGIPADLLPKLFTPFFTTKGERGTGLGLCLAQQIVERHGGELRLESAREGGTRARVELPEAAGALENPKKALSMPREQAPATNLRVLVVDDDPDVLQPLLTFLQRSGFSATSARSAQEGLSRLSADGANVLISDISMPGMDGIEFAQRVRKLYPDTAVVLMSGRASEVDPDRLARMGSVTLLAKPFTLRQVVDLVGSLAPSSTPRGQ